MFLPSTITLKPGDSGEFVAELQRRLAKIDLYPHDNINGIYEGLTVNAVRSFQGQNGLQVDGVAGPDTLRRLNGVLSGNSDDTASSSSSSSEEEQKAKEAYVYHELAMEQAAILSPEAAFAMLSPVANAWEAKPAAVEAPPPPPKPPEPQIDMAQELARQQQELARQQQEIARQQQQLLAQQQAMQQGPELLAQQQMEQTRHQQHQQGQQLTPDQLQQLAAQKQGLAQNPDALAKDGHSREAARLDDARHGKDGQPAEHGKGEHTGKEVDKPRNSFVQRVIDYLESKMPSEVVREVLNIGANMMRAGVRENPIASGDVVRAPEATPGMAPEQQQPAQPAQRA